MAALEFTQERQLFRKRDTNTYYVLTTISLNMTNGETLYTLEGEHDSAFSVRLTGLTLASCYIRVVGRAPLM